MYNTDSTDDTPNAERMVAMFSGKQDIYLDVADRYENFIRLGILQDGDKLPSVRQAAAELHINPNTVQKAYQHLEKKGLITTLPKKGVFVTYRRTSEATALQNSLLPKILALKDEGYTKEELLHAIEEVFTS